MSLEARVLWRSSLALLTAGLAVVPWVRAEPGPAPQQVDFLRDVKPVLAEKCLACHGPDEPEADLRLDSRDAALAQLEGGYAAVVPGSLDDSELWYRISTDDERERMPPADHGPALSKAEQATLAAWIEQGAPWEEHWGFRAAREVEAPQVERVEWVADPIDAFVLRRLEEAGLQPAEPVDDLTWLRRASFDLIGLPPSRAEIEAFLALPAATRRAQTADRLLASPHFGEKWARHMLDLVRYAETRGHEFDFPIPNAWEYRDYLIRAFNADLGWDDLLREHVAGDLLPEPRLHPSEGWNESVIGTAFWWLGEAVHSPVDLEADLADRTSNQLDVFGKAFLGLTIACARCHDHKFDPIPTRDYYSLSGFVQSASYRQVRFSSLEQNRQIRSQIHELDAAQQAAAAQAAERRVRGLALGLPARIGHASELAAAIETARSRQVLGDLQRGLGETWQVEGESYTELPRVLDPKKRGQVDPLVGRLRSPVFELKHDLLSFQVSGGKDAAKLGVRLLVEGEVVQTAVGDNSTQWRPVSWDLRPWRGKLAQVELVDEAEGGWGHLIVDRFELTMQVDELALARQASADEAEFLLALARQPLSGGVTEWSSVAAADLPQINLQQSTEAVTHWQAGQPWWQDGSSFQLQQPGAILSAGRQRLVSWLPFPAVVLDPDWRGLRFDPQVSHEGTQLNWKGSGRTFRTPQVELGEGAVWYLLRGKGVAFGPVEHHRVLGGPLHTNTALRFDTQGTWRWVRHQAMERYTGLRAHFEFSPTDEQQPLEVAAVVQGQHAPPLPELGAWQQWRELLEREDLMAQLRPAQGLELAFYEARQALLDQRVLESRLAPALLDGNGVDQRLLLRGNTATPGEPVPRAMLTRFRGDDDFIVAQRDGVPTSGRLQLVEQMIERTSPLLSRVAVNRIWHYLFGRGLAPQPDNFGVLAGYPTHPDLLDALANDFRAGDWRIKPLLRRIVLSATYGQSGQVDPRAMELDPSNDLLHHLPPRRLTAEAVRDALLAASGELQLEIGGSSVPVHLTSFMNGRGRPGSSGPLDGNRRRTIYQEIRRNFLPPFLMVWDYPPPATTMGRRSTSNVPAQALTMMNDPFVRERAEVWAQALSEHTVPEQIDALWWSALARAPRPEERQAAEAFLAEPDARLAELCHVVFNLKEFVFLP